MHSVDSLNKQNNLSIPLTSVDDKCVFDAGGISCLNLYKGYTVQPLDGITEELWVLFLEKHREAFWRTASHCAGQLCN